MRNSLTSPLVDDGDGGLAAVEAEIAQRVLPDTYRVAVELHQPIAGLHAGAGRGGILHHTGHDGGLREFRGLGYTATGEQKTGQQDGGGDVGGGAGDGDEGA